MKALAEIISIFTDNKLKVTPQRVAVYQVLSELKHASADEIIKKMSVTSPTVTVATVYNVLDCLSENGIISKISTADNRMYFDINTHDHGHLYCKKTHYMEDYEDKELIAMIENYIKNKNLDNFRVENIKLFIEGTFEKI
ncbi:MAG: transcriptional repressor [Rikenellaceae bacterium]|nr:transcriptional repressor [Rikenellaceae bacterium]